MRIGIGYDVHPFQQGRPLILGGVSIPSPVGLLGHSDADVLTHAIMDALLGAVGRGDIGRLFPDTDPALAGIRSLTLLEKVMAEVKALGFVPVNVDTVIMAQFPKLAPYTAAMQERLAPILGLEPDRLNIKATTTEGLGFIGRGEGIAAQAVVLLKAGSGHSP
ncbi:MAG TPA: 2-C-methyl-D-erythritol 2,4-cyclodiphosphate synthase [Firmicutes bacterium]|nr:2-C-methyl-D-erythritol 2,4-cyclodiphosphate synthase [Bacillota bacterium]